MDSLITPTKKEINGIESCQSFQFVCKGDGCRVKEINQKWFSFSFSHVPTEFKIKLSFLVYFLCSLLGQCRNEENWFSVFSFAYFFGINWRNKHIYKGQLELPMESCTVPVYRLGLCKISLSYLEQSENQMVLTVCFWNFPFNIFWNCRNQNCRWPGATMLSLKS